jgi:hypothetical protein
VRRVVEILQVEAYGVGVVTQKSRELRGRL